MKEHQRSRSANRDSEIPFTSLKILSPKEFGEFTLFIIKHKRSDYYDYVRQLFVNDRLIEHLAVRLAAAYQMFNARPLEQKLQTVCGLNRRKLGRLRTKIQELSLEIQRLNTVLLPGATTTIQLLRDFGREEISASLLPGSEASQEFATDIERLPNILRNFAEILESWPHPRYRTHLSDRNWEAYPLAVLCALVQAVYGKPHYDEIAVLLTVVGDFVAEKSGERPARRGRPSEGSAGDKLLAWGTVVDSESIKRNVRNFKARNPDLWLLAQRVAQHLAQETFEQQQRLEEQWRLQKTAKT